MNYIKSIKEGIVKYPKSKYLYIGKDVEEKCGEELYKLGLVVEFSPMINSDMYLLLEKSLDELAWKNIKP